MILYLPLLKRYRVSTAIKTNCNLNGCYGLLFPEMPRIIRHWRLRKAAKLWKTWENFV